MYCIFITEQQLQLKNYNFYLSNHFQMSHRKQKINLLREQVNKMQSQLSNLQKGEKQRTSKWNMITHIRDISINKKSKESHKNHSKDSRNLSKQNRSPSEKRAIRGCFTSRNQERQHIDHNLSNTLKIIISKIDDDFYIDKKTPTNILSQSQTCDKSIFYKTSYISPRYRYNKYGQQERQNSKESKLRTYAFRPTDLILNPERQQSKGIKIVRQIERSPDNMLTDNPNSNPDLYLFNTQPVYIKKKKTLTQDKNKSSIVLSPSTSYMIPSKNANLIEKQPQTQKKHFERHIQENICSKYKTIY